MSVGYIYVLSNPSYAGLIKIGFTCGNVDARSRELSASTAMVTAFVVEAYRLSDDVEEVEKLVHSALAEFRVHDKREFFKTTVGSALTIIDSHVREPTLKFARTSFAPTQDWNAVCRRCGHRFVRTIGNRYCTKCGY